jgi:predicted enzyme related to lactoylglutathione lyase
VADPVVHFEIIGKDPDKLRSYFGELFGWQFDTSSPPSAGDASPLRPTSPKKGMRALPAPGAPFR